MSDHPAFVQFYDKDGKLHSIHMPRCVNWTVEYNFFERRATFTFEAPWWDAQSMREFDVWLSESIDEPFAG